jgi:tRNA (Thr-GGU) A37 N-methylase
VSSKVSTFTQATGTAQHEFKSCSVQKLTRLNKHKTSARSVLPYGREACMTDRIVGTENENWVIVIFIQNNLSDWKQRVRKCKTTERQNSSQGEEKFGKTAEEMA